MSTSMLACSMLLQEKVWKGQQYRRVCDDWDLELISDGEWIVSRANAPGLFVASQSTGAMPLCEDVQEY